MSLRIGVFGAGSIGLNVGGLLVHGGAQVTFLARPERQAELRREGLRLTNYRGGDIVLPPARLDLVTAPEGLAGCDLVLVCVKSAQSAEAGATLDPVLKPGAVVLSLQNGLDNAGTLARLLPGRKVLAGMVPFNVVMLAAGVYHQGSSGQLVVQQDPAVDGFAEAFRHAGLPLKQAADMQGVLWAKLLLNLNNAVNALANLPLREELAQRDFRRCLALAMQEALALLELDGRVRLARLAPLPMRWLPSVLRLPDWIFARLARQMLEIDEKARSSMSDDLEAGRLPEIRWLNGEIVALALSLRRPAPVNARLCELVLAAHGAPTRLAWPAARLLAELEAAGQPRTAG